MGSQLSTLTAMHCSKLVDAVAAAAAIAAAMLDYRWIDLGK